ncbi:MAG TPA: RNA polymerase sigma factor [Gemmataceae bacterium]|nr:RNA polymerase sigma factor [Gemmataceae bacterium]
MATHALSRMMQHLRRSALQRDGAGMTDGELLDEYITGRNEAAFAALVRRHGPMVWGVCQRVLRSHHDAEDAFQATFLVLVRRAASVVPQALVGNWLYGVAHRTALNARAVVARRLARERLVSTMPEPAVWEQDLGRDLRPLLDQELSRLPAKYRAAIVLCDLEGKTRKNVAQQFGVPEGTLSGWLTRGRALLAKRLGRRGLSLASGILAGMLSHNALSAAVPALVISNTIRVARIVAAGEVAAASVVSAPVAALTKGMLKAMLLSKLKLITAMLLLLSAAGGATTALIYGAHSGKPTDPLVLPLEGQAAGQPPAVDAPKPESTRIAARQEKNAPKFTIAKETTHITGPFDQEGNLDYEAALNERLGKDITPEKNANVLLWNALRSQPKRFPMPSEFFAWLKTPAPPEHGTYFVDLLRYAGETLQLNLEQETLTIRKQRSWAAQRPWVAQDYPQIFGWLAANEKPLGVVLEAVRRPEYYNPLVSNKTGPEGSYGLLGSLLPAAVQSQREVAPALTARAMLRAGEGKFDEAWQDLLACHRLGRLIARGVDHDEFLLGTAIDEAASNAALALLDRANPSRSHARAWLRDLERLPPMPSLADKIDLGTRFTFLNTVMLARRGPIKTLRLIQILQGGPRLPAGTADPEVPQAVIDALDWNAILRAGNRWYDRTGAALQIADRAAREKELDRLEAELEAGMKNAGTAAEITKALRRSENFDPEVSNDLGIVLLDYFQRDIRRMKKAADRAEQVRRNLHVAFALAAYRDDHGRYPDKLDALVPGYLVEVPSDLYSAKALLYRSAETMYLLYSVGINGLDEGGNGVDDQPPGDDLRVRMPLPEWKRQ